jgi:hypothetical protein
MKDPATKQPSMHATAFFVGFIVALFKLIFSGTKIGGIVMSQFNGMDFASTMGALGSMFSLHHYVTNDPNRQYKPQNDPPINLPKDS